MSRQLVDFRLSEAARRAIFAALIAALYAQGLGMSFLVFATDKAYLPLFAVLCTVFAGLLEILLLPLPRGQWLKRVLIVAAAIALIFANRGTLLSLAYAFAQVSQGSFIALHVYAVPLCVTLAAVLVVCARYVTQEMIGVLAPLISGLFIILPFRRIQTAENLLYYLPFIMSILLITARDGRLGTSARRTLPLCALLLLCALMITPGAKTVEPFPSAARSVQEFIDSVIFHKEGDRDTFSLTGEGYQPLGEDKLGGKAQQENHEVLAVDTEHDLYLRGRVFKDYNGFAWDYTLHGERSAFYYYWTLDKGRRAELFDEDKLTGDTREATVCVLAQGRSTLFAPQRLRGISVAEGMDLRFDASSELYLARNIAPGDVYKVQYLPLMAGQQATDAQVMASASVRDEGLAKAQKEYTSLPEGMDARVYAFAEVAAGGESDPYKKALSIMRYLKANYDYSLDMPVPPEGMEFVYHFLFSDRREGYCTYFATALTVLLRTQGIPARYVTGFYVHANDSGTTIVRGESAHAWTEAYFNGAGWITMDATPSSNEDNPSATPPANVTPPPAPQTPPPTPTPAPTTQPQGGQATETPEPDGGSPAPSQTKAPSQTQTPQNGAPASRASGGFPWIFLLIALSAALFCLRVVLTEPVRRAKRLAPGQAFDELWNECLRALALQNLSRAPSETPIAFAIRVRGAAGTPILESAASLCTIAYAHKEADALDVSRALAAYKTLYAHLSPPQRARLALRRALAFGKKARFI